MKKIGATLFDVDYCRNFTPDELRVIYKGESVETLDSLIAELYPVEEEIKEVEIKEIENNEIVVDEEEIKIVDIEEPKAEPEIKEEPKASKDSKK